MRKRPIIVFLLAVIAISAFLLGIRFTEKGQIRQMISNGQLLCNMYPVNTYLSDEDYCIAIFENGEPIKCVVFSETRQPIRSIGIKPVTNFELQHYLGQSLTEIENEFGAYHVDIGSGYFMPSYITLDGYLVSFTFMAEDEEVTQIGKTDLFTGESIEWILTNEEGQYQ